jgi:hypothetical protein
MSSGHFQGRRELHRLVDTLPEAHSNPLKKRYSILRFGLDNRRLKSSGCARSTRIGCGVQCDRALRVEAAMVEAIRSGAAGGFVTSQSVFVGKSCTGDANSRSKAYLMCWAFRRRVRGLESRSGTSPATPFSPSRWGWFCPQRVTCSDAKDRSSALACTHPFRALRGDRRRSSFRGMSGTARGNSQ